MSVPGPRPVRRIVARHGRHAEDRRPRGRRDGPGAARAGAAGARPRRRSASSSSSSASTCRSRTGARPRNARRDRGRRRRCARPASASRRRRSRPRAATTSARPTASCARRSTARSSSAPAAASRASRRSPACTTRSRVVRMAVEDAYGAKQWREGEEGSGDEVAFRTEKITRATCRAVAEYAFRTAAAMGGKVYGGPKWTVSPVYEGMLKEEMDAAAERHPEVALPAGADRRDLRRPGHRRGRRAARDPGAQPRRRLPLATSCCRCSARSPAPSRCCWPSTTTSRPQVAMAEAPHGTAPALLGQGRRQPDGDDPGLRRGAALRGRARAAGAERASRAIYEAVLEATAAGVRTPDLGGHAGDDRVHRRRRRARAHQDRGLVVARAPACSRGSSAPPCKIGCRPPASVRRPIPSLANTCSPRSTPTHLAPEARARRGRRRRLRDAGEHHLGPRAARPRRPRAAPRTRTQGAAPGPGRGRAAPARSPAGPWSARPRPAQRPRSRNAHRALH